MMSATSPSTHPNLAWMLLILWAVCLPIVPPISVGSTPVSPVDILAIPTLYVALLQAPTIRNGSSFFGWLFVLFAMWAATTSLLISSDFVAKDSLLRAIRLLFIVTPTLLISRAELTEDRTRVLLAIVATASSLGIVMQLGLFALGDPSVQAHQEFTDRVVALSNRMGGYVHDSSAFGHALASWFVITLAVLTMYAWRYRIMLITAVTAVLIYGLYATVSRSAFVDLVVAVPALLLLAPMATRRKLQIIFGLCVALPILVASISALGPALLPEAVQSAMTRLLGPLNYLLGVETDVLDLDSLSAGRTLAWDQLSYLFDRAPLMGHGYKSLAIVYAVPADNLFISVAVETGLVGLFNLIFLIVKTVLRLASPTDLNPVTRALAISLGLGQLAHAMFVDTLTFYSSMPIVLIVIAVALTAVPQQPEAKAPLT